MTVHNLISQGSSWKKIDLHVHTSSSYDWDKKCNETAKDIIKKAVSENLSLISITDHHTVNGIDKVIKEANGKNITILPGVELRTDKGNKAIHIIGIFDNSISSKTIYDKLLCPLNFSENDIKIKGNEHVYCNFEEACQRIHEMGGIVSLHAGNKSNGIEQLDSDIRATLKKDLASLVDIFEVTSQKQVDDYQKIVFPKIKQEFPCVITSDAIDRSKLKYKNGHSIEALGKKFTWIKSEPTFQGLKEILCEPILRVLLDSQCPSYLHPQITAIEIETPKEYLNKQIIIKDRFCFGEINKFFFSSNLNSLIGGRATGKSTLLELIGFVFNKFQASENPKKPSIIENLQTKYPKVKIKVNFKFGEKEYSTEKNLTDIKTNLFGFDVIYLPQDEIEKKANNEEEITKLINSLIDESKLQFSKLTLINKKLFIEKLRSNYSQIFAKEKELKTTQEELQKIQLVLSFTQSEKYKNLVNELSSKIKEREKVNNAITNLEWQRDILLETKSELEENIKTDTLSLSDYLKQPELYLTEQSIRKILNIIDFLNKAIKEIKESTNYKKLLINLDKLNKKYIQACRQLGLDSINQSKIKDALENKGRIEIKIKQLEQEIKLIKSAKLKHNDEIKIIETEYRSHQILEKKLIDNAKTKFGSDLSITVIENQEKLEKNIINLFIKYQKLSGKYGLKEPDIKSIIKGLSLKEIISHLKQNKIPIKYNEENGTNENKVTAQFFFIDKNFLYREILIMNLEETLPENNFIITFKGKKLYEMSFGERCGVVLRLILSNSNLPLIIDQPEDHLDNKYIVKELLDLVKQKKQERQIILSTHNPNIVVNGDSELIIGLEVDSKTGYSRVQSGALEKIKIRELITGILEGGQEAFLKRERKYDFKNI
ncbi:MAG: hypothetical protein UR63_C0043G0021 [Candidatus Roizmanbacteria bacterium GW2011_GWC2_35_12]|uniref:Polymerase/histidinol phosphatase N-terminal domain-containing protein n=2 Tax=Candidatus Roizmaniibacteriota TaxID=1752723 RepID=A0A0F9YZ22_9BACT|nr:MAG: hypothetical protein UR23_C0013G0005 [Candidatus Roizmanbacteria bacterium GW2011_GWA2_32_13]KKP65826.1 MAG: hypothetical protein UR63_C0043G0021 [Candidatus Roizmanbacteria bacterium GW2011_GWC2_35_12]